MPGHKQFRTFIGKLEQKGGLQAAIRLCDDKSCASFREAREQAKKIYKAQSARDERLVAYVACDDYSPLAMAGIRREMIENFGDGFRVDVTPAGGDGRGC